MPLPPDEHDDGPVSITLTAVEYAELIADNERLGNQVFEAERRTADMRVELALIAHAAHDTGFNEGLDAAKKALVNPFRDVSFDDALSALRKP